MSNSRFYFCQSRSFVFILAMIVVTTLMVAVWEFTYIIMQNSRIAGNMVKELQAIGIARAAFRGSLAILQYDKDDIDGPHDEWRILMPPMLPVGEGMAKLEIEAEDGKLNINHLVNDFDDDINSTIASYLRELFIILKYDDNLIYSMADFIDKNSDSSSFGAERDYYESLQPPVVIKNGILDTISELLMVKGITHTMFLGSDSDEEDEAELEDRKIIVDEEEIILPNGLVHYLTVYGEYAKNQQGKALNYSTININYIPLLLLRAMDENLTEFSLEKIHEHRQSFNFTEDETKNRDTMMTMFGLSDSSYQYLFASGRLGVRSQYFRIRGIGEVDNITKTVDAVVKRANKRFKILYYTEI